MKTILLTTTAVLFAGAASTATLVNGSLTGPLGAFAIPAGWTSVAPSPDTNDQSFSGAGGSYAVAADNSNDGGTWVGFGREGSTNEIIGQTISDFVIGTTYELSWEAANFGIANFPQFNNANSIVASLDGVAVGNGAALGVSSSWFDQSITFEATSTTHLLSFGLLNDVTSYMQLDGVSLSAVTTPVPVPAAGLMLATAVGGFAVARRKSKAA